VDAVTTAVQDTVHRPSVVSISWGGPETTWTAQAINEMETGLCSANGTALLAALSAATSGGPARGGPVGVGGAAGQA
jgi:kumamolisin